MCSDQGTKQLGALGAGARCKALGSQGRGARCAGARSVGRSAGRAVRASGTGAGRATWARCWPTGCALGALNLFLARFDSVLFMSQFLDIVREPGS